MSVHPNVTRVWTEWVIEKDHHPKCVLVVETDLETRPDAADFDSSTFDDMVNAVVSAFDNHPSERINVVPKR